MINGGPCDRKRQRKSVLPEAVWQPRELPDDELSFAVREEPVGRSTRSIYVNSADALRSSIGPSTSAVGEIDRAVALVARVLGSDMVCALFAGFGLTVVCRHDPPFRRVGNRV